MVLTPSGTAAKYLQDSSTGLGKLADGIRDIRALLAEVDLGDTKHIQLYFHDRVLRYSFIGSDEFIWIKFFTNSAGRALVPAFKIRAGSPKNLGRPTVKPHEVKERFMQFLHASA